VHRQIGQIVFPVEADGSGSVEADRPTDLRDQAARTAKARQGDRV